MHSGIYKFICLWTAKVYIGSAVNLDQRKRVHFSMLRRGVHKNKKLQSAWNKYGEDLFEYEVIEYVNNSKEDLEDREQFWLDYYNASVLGYNLSPTSMSNRGCKRPDVTLKQLGVPLSKVILEKLRLANKGRKMSEEHKKVLKKFLKGNQYAKGNRFCLTEEQKEKQRKTWTPERREAARLRFILNNPKKK